MYMYTLELLIDNPMNISDSDDDCMEEFYIDYEYGSPESYRLDMSWNGTENKNGGYAAIFKSSSDDSQTAKMNVWIPGKGTGISIHLNMSGGEKLSFSIAAVTLGGFKVNKNTDWVSSSRLSSEASVSCSAPDSQPDLRMLDDGQLTSALDKLYSGSVTGDEVLRDQFDSLADTALLEAAHNEMLRFIKAGNRPGEHDAIEDYAMFKTVYCANQSAALQQYVMDKRTQYLDTISAQ